MRVSGRIALVGLSERLGTRWHLPSRAVQLGGVDSELPTSLRTSTHDTLHELHLACERLGDGLGHVL